MQITVSIKVLGEQIEKVMQVGKILTWTNYKINKIFYNAKILFSIAIEINLEHFWIFCRVL